MTKLEKATISAAVSASGYISVQSKSSNWKVVDLGFKIPEIYVIVPLDIKSYRMKLVFFPNVFHAYNKVIKQHNIKPKKLGGGKNFKTIELESAPILPSQQGIVADLHNAYSVAQKYSLI